MQLIWSLDTNGTKLIWFDMKSGEMWIFDTIQKLYKEDDDGGQVDFQQLDTMRSLGEVVEHVEVFEGSRFVLSQHLKHVRKFLLRWSTMDTMSTCRRSWNRS